MTLEFHKHKLDAKTQGWVLAANLGAQRLEYSLSLRPNLDEPKKDPKKTGDRFSKVMESIETIKSQLSSLIIEHAEKESSLSDFDLLSSPLFINRYLLATLEAELHYLSYDEANKEKVLTQDFSNRYTEELRKNRVGEDALSEYYILFANRYSYIKFAREQLNNDLYKIWFQAFQARDFDNLLFDCDNTKEIVQEHIREIQAYDRGFQQDLVTFALKYGYKPL